MRLRTIKKYGDSYAIKLEPADIRDFNLSVGQKVDIEDMIVRQVEKEVDAAISEDKK